MHYLNFVYCLHDINKDYQPIANEYKICINKYIYKINLCGRLLYSTDGLMQSLSRLFLLIVVFASSSSRAVIGVGLRSFACWDCGFKSRRGHGRLSLCQCCVSSGSGPCDRSDNRPEEFYRV